ncbi:patatin-like phospholipase family protein [Desemzia incerta]|uniref:patatin-like phospholipase family protein n=1 Tax=Desemzia incerta TaxID=82801 RepID=UPI0024C3B5D5|nr:patatin-like phospholipase family protein [Desemzia incerta]WHZ31536.1 patatin-like phospholipase family protein [Desemzia incerta]
MSKERYVKTGNSRVALVLGGGGARGSYQVGVWKAIRELGIQPDIITGTSVGALNGAAILQGDYELVEQMWKELEIKNVVEFELPEKPSSFNEYGAVLSKFILTAIKNRGISSKPLHTLIKEFIIDEKKIQESGIDFGITVTELSSREQQTYYLEDIPYGQLDLYLLASASLYPAMSFTEIEGKHYADGGYRENVPVDPALTKQPDLLIIVDINTNGKIRDYTIPDEIETHHITSKWPLGDMLLFDGSRAEVNIQLGYLDTMKSFEMYEGSWYTFDKDSLQQHSKRFYKQLADFLLTVNDDVKSYLHQEENQLFLLGQLNTEWMGMMGKKELPYALYELSGKMLHIPPTKVYEFNEFEQEILDRYQQMTNETSFQDLVKVLQNNRTYDFVKTAKEWQEELKESIPFLSPLKVCFYFLSVLENEIENAFKDWKGQLLIRIYPYPFAMALFLYFLKQK